MQSLDIEVEEKIKSYQNRIEVLEHSNRQLQEAFQELAALQEMARVVSTTYKLETIARLLVDLAGEIVEYRWCALFLHDKEKQKWIEEISVGLDDKAQKLIQTQIDEGLINWAVYNRRPTIIPAEQDGITGTYIIVPLIVGGTPMAILHLLTDLPESRFVGQHFEMLGLLANQAATAIENARLWQNMVEIKDYMNNIIECMRHGVLVLDRNRHVTIINRQAQEMLDLPEGVVREQDYRDIFPPIVAQQLDLLLEQTFLNGRVELFEIEYSKTDAALSPSSGKEEKMLPLGITSSLLRDKAGNLQGVILICRDLTLRREVVELRRLDQLKSEFVSNVSHELKTPLTSIKAYTETLLDDITEGEVENQKDFLQIINAEADRLARLISDLLDLSQIERGKLEIESKPHNLGKLIQQVLQLFSNELDNHPITVDIPSDLPLIDFDADKIHQVFINLINNAIKYSPQSGPIHIKVILEKEKVYVRIRDYGIGIAPEDREKIFEKFYRSRASLGQQVRGTGLGLPIARYIIEAHGGQIWVEETEEPGSCFCFWLPQRKVPNEIDS